MLVISSVSESSFRDAMNKNHKDNFSYYALGALYNHLDNTEQQEELHPADIDSAWCEYNYYDLENDYGYMVDSDDLEECEDEDDKAELIIAHLESKTTVIRIDEANILCPEMSVNAILIMTQF